MTGEGCIRYNDSLEFLRNKARIHFFTKTAINFFRYDLEYSTKLCNLDSYWLHFFMTIATAYTTSFYFNPDLDYLAASKLPA